MKNANKIVVAKKSDHYVVYEYENPSAYDIFEKTEDGIDDLFDYLSFILVDDESEQGNVNE